MRMKNAFHTLLLCSLFLPVTVIAAPTKIKPAPQVQITVPIYSWRTESEKNQKTGQLDHCLVKNMYDNGTLLILAQNNSGEKRLALNFAQSKMQEGQHFDLAIQVDKRDVFPVEAIAISPQTLNIGIPDALPDQMRKGQAMHLRGPNDEVVFDLSGMDGAVMALQDCIITQKNHGVSPVMVASNDQPKDKTEDESTLVPLPKEKPAAPLPAVMQPPLKTVQKVAPVKTVSNEIKSPVIEDELVPITPPVPRSVSHPVMRPVSVPVPTPTAAKPILAPAVASSTSSVPVTSHTLDNPLPDRILPTSSVAPVTAQVAPPVLKPVPSSIPAYKPVDNKTIDIAGDTGLPPAWQAVFNGTPFAPDKLIPMKNKTADQPLDYIWKKNDLFFGVKGKTMMQGDALTTMSVDYLQMLKSRCAGHFLAQSSQPQQSAKTNITWQVTEAACSNSSNGDSIAALIFAFTPQGGQIYYSEAKASNGGDAIKARDIILKKLLQ